jgi:RNA polymerase sigma factor (sigma-70 family)
MTEARQLLRDYATTGSETAFQDVVVAYLNLVYSTALRLVNGDSHLAEDVTQRVFADLAKMAGDLSHDVMIGGWLHRHTCYIASKTIRTERRRQAREQQAVLMKELNESSPENIAVLAPVLDDAINQLGSKDRQAIVLRFFEQRDFRSVGDALAVNEDAARKRVDRALDKLRVLLKRRGLTFSAAALGTALSSSAVSAAPAALAIGIAHSALATVASGGTTAIALLQFMSMTKFQAAIIATLVVAFSVPLVLQQRTANRAQAENEALRGQLQQMEQVTAENARLSNLLAKAQPPAPSGDKQQQRELLKLRGEVGTLRKTAEDAAASAAKATEAPLSGITANPEMQKMLRNQQKMALSAIYKGFADRAKLAPEKSEELNSFLADNVMTNIDHITAILREGKSASEMEQILARQEADSTEHLKKVLGPEAYEKYEQYNRELASYLTAEQFKTMLSGDKEAKDAQGNQLFALMQQETQKALTARGLSSDYQTIPTLNFRNFASEQDGEKNIQLLDAIYEQVQANAGTFLKPEELAKFAEFRTLAINNNRLALSLNRKLMAPPNK